MTFLISPLAATGWKVGRDELIELLKRDWSVIEIINPSSPTPDRELAWVLDTGVGRLEGEQQENGQAQVLSGGPQAIARYATWWRTQVASDQELALYDETFSTVISLEQPLPEDEIARLLAG